MDLCNLVQKGWPVDDGVALLFITQTFSRYWPETAIEILAKYQRALLASELKKFDEFFLRYRLR